jgi:hypothetical protein
LPWVGGIHLLRKELATVFQWSPIGVVSDDLTKIRAADVEDTRRVQLVRLYHAQTWIL